MPHGEPSRVTPAVRVSSCCWQNNDGRGQGNSGLVHAQYTEAEWSSGVAAFWGGCYNQDIFKDSKTRQYHDVSVLYTPELITI